MIRKGQACCSVGLLHHFILRSVRGDELKCRSSTPTFGSITKLATHPDELLDGNWPFSLSRCTKLGDLGEEKVVCCT
jgi:hypothetical protein